MIRWLGFFGLAALLGAYAFWIYARAELPVRGARALALLRALVLTLVLLLLFDPRLPSASAGSGSSRWVLLDASLSMSAGAAGAPTAWESARARAQELSRAGWRVVRFGGVGEALDADTTSGPDAARTLLAPALERAAEAGAREVRVLSDLRLEDAVAVRSALEAMGVDVSFEGFGGVLVNAGVSRLLVPDAGRPQGTLTVEVEVHAQGADSLSLDVLREGAVLASVRVPAPSPGLRATVPVEIPVTEAAGRVRYGARVSVEGDAFPSDDEAVAYATVGHEEGTLVLVSFRPDWEPRYLLPVLADVTGLRARGYLRVGADRFVPVGRALDRGVPVDSTVVAAAVEGAAMVVLHGVHADLDAWGRRLVAASGGGLVFAMDPGGAELVGVRTGAARPGEWYVSPELPPSPLAGDLTGAVLQGLPPLSGLLVTPEPPPLPAPLRVQLRGAGPLEGALWMQSRPEGGVVVALGSGFWRWAARGGGAADAYRRLWSGVAGWLLARRRVASAEVRPARWVFDRADIVRWSVPAEPAAIRLVVETEGGGAALDTVLADGGESSTGRLAPGTYRYRAEGPDGDSLGAGRFDVAARTEEMLPEPVIPAPAQGIAATVGGAGSSGRPLRTSPWPYLLILCLVCAEWIGRRRVGLR